MKEIMDSNMMERSLKRIAHEILERNKGTDHIVLVGIKRKGEAIAERLKDHIYKIEDVMVPCLSIDFTPWRDDINESDLKIEQLDFDFKDKIVILCDDVLFRGRTARAAMDGIMYYGRAKMIQLAVLIDRGHRELPIKADFVGKNVPTSEKEMIKVYLHEFDNADRVVII